MKGKERKGAEEGMGRLSHGCWGRPYGGEGCPPSTSIIKCLRRPSGIVYLD